MEYQGFSCTCTKCGRTLYEGEMLNIKGKYICENCADSYIFGRSEYSTKPKRRMPSPFFHLICSLTPGAGHMYLGLMKRGLFQMCMFFLAIYLCSLMPTFFGLLIPIIWMYSFFDSLSLKRRILNGEYVSDNLGGISSYASRYKGVIILAVAAILVLGIASPANYTRHSSTRGVTVVTEDVHRGPYSAVETTTYYVDSNRGLMNLIIPLAIIGLGGVLLVKSSNRRKAEKELLKGGNDWHYEDK